jgi:nuclear pore complex protein Nup133
MLSLSKLAAIATEDDSPKLIESINNSLTLIEHQEQLPMNLLAAFGYDDNQTKVLEPEELIALYVSPENAEATEVEFRKALELLSYVDPEDVDDVKHKIWCAAILRDTWSDYNADAASDVMQDMLFFKLIDLCHFLGEFNYVQSKLFESEKLEFLLF